VQPRNAEDAFRQDAQEGVVGFRLAAIKLVVNDRMTMPAGCCDAVVDPERADFCPRAMELLPLKANERFVCLPEQVEILRPRHTSQTRGQLIVPRQETK